MDGWDTFWEVKSTRSLETPKEEKSGASTDNLKENSGGLEKEMAEER